MFFHLLLRITKRLRADPDTSSTMRERGLRSRLVDFWCKGAVGLLFRLQFVPEPDAGTPREHCRIGFQQRTSSACKTAIENNAVNLKL
jgi:hypothetical protein